MSLAHQFPFRLVELGSGAGVAVTLSSNAYWCRDGETYPATLAIEIMAQASILVLPKPEGDAGQEKTPGLLAGVDGARFEAPLRAGDRLVASAEIAGRFGSLVKVTARLHRDNQQLVAEAGLLLAFG